MLMQSSSENGSAEFRGKNLNSTTSMYSIFIACGVFWPTQSPLERTQYNSSLRDVTEYTNFKNHNYRVNPIHSLIVKGKFR